jgi:hypothetical protein
MKWAIKRLVGADPLTRPLFYCPEIMATKKPKKRKWHRTRESYVSQDPVKRENSLANLRQFTNGGPKGGKPWVNQKILEKLDIITFATEYLSGVSFEKRPAQEVTLRALYGLPLTEEQVKIYTQLTTNEKVFQDGIEKTEGNFPVGARGGKSYLAALIALYESICRAHIWKKYLNKGEAGYAVITATKQKQSEDIVQASCTRMLENSPLAYMIKNSWRATLELKNDLIISSYPCNSTAARGLPIFLLIFDELAHYRVEGPKADEMIYSALRPRQAQFPGAKCLKISTVAAKQGLLWEEFKEGFQVPGRLTIQAHTRLMNPTIPQAFIDKEYKRDPDNAAREFGAEFAETVSGFFASCIEKLNACFQLPGDVPYDKNQSYFASIDQSGLSGNDRFAFGIAHHDSKKVTLDILREWSTTEADLILEEIKQLCAIYRIRKVTIDRYAGGWVKNALEKIGLEVEFRDMLPIIYTNLKTLVLANKALLPDYPNLRKALMTTAAWYGKSNTLSIGHERNLEGHGDVADVAADATYQASQDMTVHDMDPWDEDYEDVFDVGVTDLLEVA